MKINSGPYAEYKKEKALTRIIKGLINNKINKKQLRVAYVAELHMASYSENLFHKSFRNLF